MGNYILLKDIPDAKAGSLLTPYTLVTACKSKDLYAYMNINRENSYLESCFVENNPEWFKQEELYTPDFQMNGRVTKVVWMDVDNKEHTIDFEK